MKDWIEKLDEFLRISEKKLLAHMGKLSAAQAQDKARQEFEEYRKQDAIGLADLVKKKQVKPSELLDIAISEQKK